MYILSIGTNQGDRRENLNIALNHLSEIGEIVNISSIYETPSWGYNGGKYLNICVEWKSSSKSLSPLEHLDFFQDIEYRIGRRRTNIQYTDRIIDIDIISLNNEIINESRLKIPHVNMHLRNFVLIPLAEICPQFWHPVLKKDVETLIKECVDKGEITVYGSI